VAKERRHCQHHDGFEARDGAVKLAPPPAERCNTRENETEIASVKMTRVDMKRVPEGWWISTYDVSLGSDILLAARYLRREPPLVTLGWGGAKDRGSSCVCGQKAIIMIVLREEELEGVEGFAQGLAGVGTSSWWWSSASCLTAWCSRYSRSSLVVFGDGHDQELYKVGRMI